MSNARLDSPKVTQLNPVFPEMTDGEIRELMTRLRGEQNAESYRKLYVCTFNREVTESGSKDE